MIAPIFVAVAGLASLAAAQSTAGVGNQTIVPTSVDVNTRNGWCRAQQDSCTALCNENWSTNDCDIDTLEAECECADGSTPDLAIYLNTLPYFICQEYIGQCVNGNSTEPTLQNLCRTSNICGNLDPTEVEFSTTLRSSTRAPTSTAASGTSTGTGTPAETTAASSESASSTPNAGIIVEPAATGFMGMAVLVAAMGLAGFGLIL
ncbi:hypothetical protein ABW19_dt0209763 [Dactylella cylindrospora]|nr:hypothetical protein ABW19_dt0209763 [Dactylella cylindrospora]